MLKDDKEMLRDADLAFEKIKQKEKEAEMAETKFLHNNVHGEWT